MWGSLACSGEMDVLCDEPKKLVVKQYVRYVQWDSILRNQFKYTYLERYILESQQWFSLVSL